MNSGYRAVERIDARSEPSVAVCRLEAGDEARWDRFVESAEGATFFHLSGWRRVIEGVFSHPTYYLCAEQDGRLGGVLPLAHIRSLVFGNALISMPFCVYGGILSDNPEAHAALEREACRLAADLGVDYLEMRSRSALHGDWPQKDLYVTFRKTLSADEEENFRAIPRKQRAMVRKGIDAGLVDQIDDGIDRFYDAYSASVRDLGTPVFGRGYFAALKQVFGERCEVLTVTRQQRVVSSVMSFYFRDEVLPYYGGGPKEARQVKANDFMYWALMRRACNRGIRVFDYGRSKIDTGSYRFKKHWGFAPEPLYYAYHLVRADTVPDVSPNNPRYRLFIEAWKRLPLPLTRLLGPAIARNLG